jgi:hypothetical protein
MFLNSLNVTKLACSSPANIALLVKEGRNLPKLLHSAVFSCQPTPKKVLLRQIEIAVSPVACIIKITVIIHVV